MIPEGIKSLPSSKSTCVWHFASVLEWSGEEKMVDSLLFKVEENIIWHKINIMGYDSLLFIATMNLSS